MKEGIGMEIVELSKDRWEHIHDLYNLCDRDFVLPFSERKTRAKDMMDGVFNSGTYYGILQGERLIACCGLRIIDNNTAQLHGLIVHPDHRGEGLARSLLGHIIECARQEGIRSLLTGSWESSHTMKMLDKLGFKEIERYHDPGERPEGVRSVKLKKELK